MKEWKDLDGLIKKTNFETAMNCQETMNKIGKWKNKRYEKLKEKEVVKELLDIAKKLGKEDSISEVCANFEQIFSEYTEGMGKRKKVFDDIVLQKGFLEEKNILLAVSERGIGYQEVRHKHAKYDNFRPTWIPKLIENKDKVREYIKKTYQKKFDEMIEELEKIDIKEKYTGLSILYNKGYTLRTFRKSGNRVVTHETEGKTLKITENGKTSEMKGRHIEELLKNGFNLNYKKLKEKYKELYRKKLEHPFQKMLDAMENLNSANKVVDNL